MIKKHISLLKFKNFAIKILVLTKRKIIVKTKSATFLLDCSTFH